MFLRNVDSYTNHTALYHRRRNSSNPYLYQTFYILCWYSKTSSAMMNIPRPVQSLLNAEDKGRNVEFQCLHRTEQTINV
jgi:hypothetical protein